MSEHARDAGLKRRIGFWLLTLYGLGVMVGAGVYVLTGAVVGAAGVYAPLAFLGAGLIAAPTALTYADLAARIPEAGGEVAYLREAFGAPWLSLLAGVLIIGGALVSASVVLQGGVGYLQGLVPAPRATLIVIVGALLTAAAVIGVLESLALAAIFTVIEVLGLLAVAAAGFAAPPSVDWTAGAGGLASGGGVAFGALLAFFAFVGFEDIVNMAEETREPERTVPKAIFASLAATTLLYALVSWAAVRAVDVETLAGSRQPLALIMTAGFGGGAALLAAVAVFAALNGVLAQIVMASRMFFGLSRQVGLLAPLAKAHPRFGTPARATVLLGAAVIVMALSLPMVGLAGTSASVLLLAFCGMNATLIVLNRRGPAESRGYRAPAWAPWAGLLASAAALAWSFAS